MSFEPHDTALTLAIKKSQSASESQLRPFSYQVLKGGKQVRLKLQLNRRDINLYCMPFKAYTRFNFFFSSFEKNSFHAFDTILEFLSVYQLTCRNFSVFSNHCLRYIRLYC